MATLKKPKNEDLRLEAIKRYDILDTPPDGNFDRITKLASTIFNVPIAIISLVDRDRIWFKSAEGLTINQIPREPGLCASAILSNDIYVVNDASKDVRTLANPLVAGEFGLKFYAAMPLQTEAECNLGTLCIIDKVPRTLSLSEQEILKQLAEIVMDEMDLRLALRNTVNSVKKLATDIGYQLDETIEELNRVDGEVDKEKTLSYFEASRLYLNNVENQLNLL